MSKNIVQELEVISVVCDNRSFLERNGFSLSFFSWLFSRIIPFFKKTVKATPKEVYKIFVYYRKQKSEFAEGLFQLVREDIPEGCLRSNPWEKTVLDKGEATKCSVDEKGMLVFSGIGECKWEFKCNRRPLRQFKIPYAKGRRKFVTLLLG